MSNLLTGNTRGTAYTGTAANQPANWSFEQRPPNQYDIQYSVGDLWLDQSATPEPEAWVLVSLAGDMQSKGELAHWQRIGSGNGTVKTLTGDTGGAVGPDAAGNIDTLGTANVITVTGNPGTNTLTWNAGGHIATSYPTDSGTAVPSGNALIIRTNNASNNAGSSVLFTGSTNIVQLNVTDVDSNTLVGKNSGNLSLSGAGNTGLGAGSLFNLSTGDANTAIGLNALQGISTGNDNTAVGNTSLQVLGTGSSNTAVGQGSLIALTSTNNNVAVGVDSLNQIVTGASNTALGTSAGSSLTTNDSNNTLINYAGVAGSNNKWFFSIPNGSLFFHNFGGSNVFAGEAAGNATLGALASNNVGIGFHSLTALNTSGSPGIGSQHTAVGHNTLASMVNNGVSNVAIGANVLQSLTQGTANTGVGASVLINATNASNNTAIGQGNMPDLTTGSDNVGVGYGGLDDLTTGNNNVAIGLAAINQLVTGSFNLALGNYAGGTTSTGLNYTGAESSNIVINNIGVTGESNVMRIGTTGAGDGQVNKCFIAAIRGVTTDINDAVAVLIDSAGQLGTVSSSIRYKENIKDMGHESDVMMQLRPVIFNYKKDEKKVKQYGLIAEEVAEVFPRLVVYDKEGNAETVKYHELPIMLLNELKKQQKTINALSMSVRHLENVLQTKKDCSCN